MAVSYKKLFKLLIDRDMKKKDFKELTGISQGTLNKLQNGVNVMVDVLDNALDISKIYRNSLKSIQQKTWQNI